MRNMMAAMFTWKNSSYQEVYIRLRWDNLQNIGRTYQPPSSLSEGSEYHKFLREEQTETSKAMVNEIEETKEAGYDGEYYSHSI